MVEIRLETKYRTTTDHILSLTGSEKNLTHFTSKLSAAMSYSSLETHVCLNYLFYKIYPAFFVGGNIYPPQLNACMRAWCVLYGERNNECNGKYR